MQLATVAYEAVEFRRSEASSVDGTRAIMPGKIGCSHPGGLGASGNFGAPCGRIYLCEALREDSDCERKS